MSRNLAMLGRLLATLTCLALPAWASAQGQAPAGAGATRPNTVEAMEAGQSGGNIVLRLKLKDAPARAPAAFSIANPPRIAFDLPATENGLGRSSQTFNEGDLKSVNVVQVGDRTRVVLNLNKMDAFDTRIEGKTILVTLTPQKTAAAGSPLVSRFAESRPGDVAHSLKAVNFRRGKNGEGRIVVDLSDGNTGIDIRQQGGNLVVDFLKAGLPESLKKTLDVTDFGTPVTTVSTLAQGENVRMIVTPKGLWEHNAYQSDNQFVLEVKQIIENPNKINQGSRGGYQGEKLSLNFQNIPIREVLAVVADFSNFNIVISDTVTGNITLVLKEVPWDQALDIILAQKGLDMRKNGNVIMIAPRDELASKEKMDLEAKQQISDLELTRTESFQLNYQKAADVSTLLKPAAGGTGKGTSILSGRGSVTVDARTNKIFVNDTPSRLEDVRKLIAEIDIPARQVLIEARIVVANDNFYRSLGAKLGFSAPYSNASRTTATTTSSSTTTALAASGTTTTTGTSTTTNGSTILNADGTVRAFSQMAFGGTLNSTGYASGQLSTVPTLADSMAFSMPANTFGILSSAPSIAMSLYSAGLSRFINLEISAMEADQRGKVVSSPRILTANQVEALIEQGTEIPYQQSTSSGATSTSFRKANLSLKVKPQITPDGNVQMEVEVNKDTVGSLSLAAGITIDTKHVKTNVQVENGGTVVIGGIYEENNATNTTKVPLLGDIPLVGHLFKSTDKQTTKTELLIFLTPKVVSDNLSLR